MFDEQCVGDDALGVPSTKPTSMGGFVAFFIVLLGFWGIEPQNPRRAVEGASPYNTPTNRNLTVSAKKSVLHMKLQHAFLSMLYSAEIK